MTTLRQLREELEGLGAEARKPLSLRRTFNEHVDAHTQLMRAMRQKLPLLLAIVEMAEAASSAFPQKNGDWVKVQDCPDIGLFGGERITAFNAARAKVDGLLGQTGAGS